MSLDDLFNAATGLGKLGIVGILALDAILLVIGFVFEFVVPGRSFRREAGRADRNLSGWEASTEQFERALDVIEKMQGGRPAPDGGKTRVR